VSSRNGRATLRALDFSERQLHAVPDRVPVDLDAAEEAARGLLLALGADIDAAGLQDTPGRIARAYAELLTPVPFNATTFPNDEGYDELVVVRDIPFQSLCMHHMLPFHGTAHVAYLPGERIVKARPRRRLLRPRPAGPGAPHDPGRRLD
jgi:GTP cyclohydrolase I